MSHYQRLIQKMKSIWQRLWAVDGVRLRDFEEYRREQMERMARYGFYQPF